MIVYAPGEIKTFVLPLTEDSRVKQKFDCQPAATVHLSGQILPTELARESNAELVLDYMAYWAHGFFGIADGIVTELRLATVSTPPPAACHLKARLVAHPIRSRLSPFSKMRSWRLEVFPLR
jgi:hypothetical protein